MSNLVSAEVSNEVRDTSKTKINEIGQSLLLPNRTSGRSKIAQARDVAKKRGVCKSSIARAHQFPAIPAASLQHERSGGIINSKPITDHKTNNNNNNFGHRSFDIRQQTKKL